MPSLLIYNLSQLLPAHSVYCIYLEILLNLAKNISYFTKAMEKRVKQIEEN